VLIALLAALREEQERLFRGEIALRRVARAARAALLQRENASFARMKKQHLPMKKPFFHLDGPSFSISIRTASECSFSVVVHQLLEGI
jgi:hypothetical protein